MQGSLKAKDHIHKVVKIYKEVFPVEYERAKEAAQMTRALLKDKNYATVEGSDPSHRAILEWPETLYMMLVRNLEVEELLWLRTIPGTRWFARSYKEFALPQKI